MIYAFVSCDIIGHSRESSLQSQCERIAAINEIVRQAIATQGAANAVWASGGDGGHVAFMESDFAENAVNLIIAWRCWSIRDKVPLRIVANCGYVERITGADGRVQLVGHGINLAGRLLQFADQNRVVVTQPFREAVRSASLDRVQFHDERIVEPIYFSPQSVCLMSVDDLFESQWDIVHQRTDRETLQAALRERNGLEVVYRAKRLLQVDANDQDARLALRRLASAGSSFLNSDNLMSELLRDKEYGEEYIRSMQLVERNKGDILCQAGEEGQTMFMILRGELAGYFSLDNRPNELTARKPNFTMPLGDLAGELAFALQRRRTATLQCLEETAMLSFSYSDFMRSLSESERRLELKEFLDRKLRSRIVEHVCNSSPFLVGQRPDGSAMGPLSSTKNTVIEPWVDLSPFFRIIELDYRVTQEFDTKDDAFATPGVYILLSGTVELVDGNDEVMDGESEPILYVNLPREIDFKQRKYRLMANVKIGAIGASGLVKFGVPIYRDIIRALRDCLPGRAALGLRRKIMNKKHVFLSYCRDNSQEVSQLRNDLIAAGEHVWWDQDILGGQNWKREIRTAMKNAYAVIACFSKETDARLKSGMYPELLDAIKEYREYAPNSIFLIPVLLSDASIPDIEISDTQTLDNLQHIDLSPSQWKDGLQNLIKSLQKAPARNES